MIKDNDLVKAMSDLHDELVYYIVKQMLEDGRTRGEVQLLLDKGMKAVGEKYETGEYYLGDLICSGLIYDTVLKFPEMQMKKQGDMPVLGKVLVGTVEGDVHDLGKSLLISTLAANGFEVIDLGVDLAIDDFVTAVKENKPDILAMSGILSSSVKCVTATIEQLNMLGLHDSMLIVIGGNAAMRDVLARTGADAYGENTIEGLDICLKYVKDRGHEKN